MRGADRRRGIWIIILAIQAGVFSCLNNWELFRVMVPVRAQYLVDSLLNQDHESRANAGVHEFVRGDELRCTKTTDQGLSMKR